MELLKTNDGSKSLSKNEFGNLLSKFVSKGVDIFNNIFFFVLDNDDFFKSK